MPQPLDADAVGRWCRLALHGLGEAREAIDAINVYPVADQDTGTNLYLTMESATQAVGAAEDVGTGRAGPTLAEAARAMAHGALIGARGNSGTILAQLLCGVADILAAASEPVTGNTLQRALHHAAEAAYEAVAQPVEGTMLTVATVAADAARTADTAGGSLPDIAAAAARGAADALARTPGQLPALCRAGVVDAGGSGLLALLEALDAALSGRAPTESRRHGPGRPWRTEPAGPVTAGPVTAGPASSGTATDVPAGQATGCPHHRGGSGVAGPSHEVTYLLDAADSALPTLRSRLGALGDSLVAVGGDGLWNVHLHTDDPGAAVEAGLQAGHPHRIRITHLGTASPAPSEEPSRRAVLALVPGTGLADLCQQAGAVPFAVPADELPASGEIAAAIGRLPACEVVLLPNDDRLRHAAAAAAEQVRGRGVRIAVIPTRSPVQGIAALAVHTPDRRFDEDVVAMTSAAGATRFGELVLASQESWTSAGVCQAGDLLGMIDGDVAVIGTSLADVATGVLDRMLSGGGELVTLVLGSEAPDSLGHRLEDWVRRNHLGVDTVVCTGHQVTPLLLGVE